MYGLFEQRFVLPEGVKTDELKAKFANGILEITMPAPAITKARKIEIEAPKEEKKVIETEEKKLHRQRSDSLFSCPVHEQGH